MFCVLVLAFVFYELHSQRQPAHLNGAGAQAPGDLEGFFSVDPSQVLLLQRAAGRCHLASYTPKGRRRSPSVRYFFCVMAAWLNEGRCPGGRPSVSTNYITLEASVFCIEMTTVHAIYNHRIKLAVSQRVPFG